MIREGLSEASSLGAPTLELSCRADFDGITLGLATTFQPPESSRAGAYPLGKLQ
jgi:hypothetical protein